jgi:hypothetical protein
MSGIEFYDIVRILPTDAAMSLGVADALGIVVGISGEVGREAYAILVSGRTFMVESTDLARTGDRVRREAVYGGESIRVPAERYSGDDDDNVAGVR